MGNLFSRQQQQPCGCTTCVQAGTATNDDLFDEIAPRLVKENCPLCSEPLASAKRSPVGRFQLNLICACRHLYHTSCMTDLLMNKFGASYRLNGDVDVPVDCPFMCTICRTRMYHACGLSFQYTSKKRWCPPWTTTGIDDIEASKRKAKKEEEKHHILLAAYAPVSSRTRSRAHLSS